MAGAGSVAWLFEKKGLIAIDVNIIKEDQLMEIVLNAGAEDLSNTGEKYEIITDPHNFETVKKALDDAKVKYELATLQMLPKNLAPVSSDQARQVAALIEALDDHDDVQNVYTNCDFPHDVLKELQQ